MLKQQLQKEQITAMKSGDKARLGVLRYIVSQIKNKEIDTKNELSDAEVVQILRKQIKELKDGIESFKKGGREDLIQENEQQIAIISEYLPPEISDDELDKEIENLVSENKESIDQNPKSIIGIAMNALKSKAEPGRISAALKRKGHM
ncbi:MAG: GatB/YqeY domain-containing protein [Patescibacteria group bacterium]